MKLQIFLDRHKIRLQKKTLLLCKLALAHMKNSIDPVHNHKHIERIIGNLDYLLIKSKKLKRKINFNVLLLTIFWHDVWISRHKAKNLLHLVLLQFIEGYGSAKAFYINARSIKLNNEHLVNTYYAIRKHSSGNLIPPKTLEAKILIDLDKLELWNNVRLLNSKETLSSNKELYKKYLVRFYYYYSYKMGFYFSELDRLLEKYSHGLWKKIY